MYRSEFLDIELLKPYEDNPRIIPEEAVLKVAESLKRYQWRSPIVVDKEMVIIIGHVRYLAARHLGLTYARVHVAEDLSPLHARALRITDNRVAEETDWEFDSLSAEIQSLRDNAEFDQLVASMGISDDELRLMRSEWDRSLGMAAVEDQDLERAETAEEGRFNQVPTRPAMRFTCSECGEEFEIDAF